MGAMAGGDLTQSINREYQGEFRVLKEAINDTTAKLASTIAEVSREVWAEVERQSAR